MYLANPLLENHLVETRLASVRRNLAARPSTSQTAHARLPSPKCRSLICPANNQLPLSDQWLVQGELLYRLEGVDNGEEHEADFVVVDLPRIFDERANASYHVPSQVGFNERSRHGVG